MFIRIRRLLPGAVLLAVIASPARAQEPASWPSVGIDPDEARQWEAAGIPFAGWAHQWKQEGFAPSEAAPWVRAKITVYTAARFRTAGFSVAEASAWIASGVRSAERAGEFRDRGFTPARAGDWWRLGFFPREAAAWRDGGFRAGEALEWHLGEEEFAYRGRSRISWRTVYSIDDARPWRAAGFSVTDARRARAYRVELPEAIAWQRAGFGLEDGVRWKDAGLRPAEAAGMRAAGVTPDEAARNAIDPRADVVTRFHSDIVLRPDARMEMTETIVFANRPAGPVSRCFSRTLPGIVMLRRGISTSEAAWPAYEDVSVLHDGAPAAVATARTADGGLTLCIGADPLEAREHTFVLRYTTDGRVMALHDHDRLYVEVNDPALAVPIDRASATVHLPPGPDIVHAGGFAGPINRQYFTTDVDDASGRDVVTYTVTRPLAPGMTFAVDASLEPGFVRPDIWQRARRLDRRMGRVVSSLSWLAGGFAAAGVYFLVAWYVVGRDPRPRPAGPEYSPRSGATPALMRYLLTRRVDRRSVAATFVRLAQSGALVVREREGCYTIHPTRNPLRGAAAHEAAFFDALFRPGDASLELARGTDRLRRARRALADALRAQSRTYVTGNIRYWWPGVLLSAAGAAISVVVLDPPGAGALGAYAAAAALSVMLLTGVFRRLLRVPTPKGQEMLEEARGLRRFLEASYRGPSTGAAHLPYAIALGVEADRVAVLDRRCDWYAGASGGFSVADFLRAFSRTPGAAS